MKKTNFLLTLAAFLLLSQPLAAQNSGYEINAKIDGAEGVTFVLQERAHGQFIRVDSAVVVNGQFRISGHTVMHPLMASLFAREKRKAVSFFLENSKIRIEGKLDSLGLAKVTGSKSQDEFALFMNALKPYQEKNAALYKDFQAASPANDTARTKALRTEAMKLSADMMGIQKDFIRQHPKSYVSPVIISSLASGLPQSEVESLIGTLDPALAKIPDMVELKAKYAAMKSVEIGQKAPDFTLNNPDGQPVSLHSKIGKNLLLVDFWAAWCGPCRRENPSVVKTYQEFSSKGFDVLGVSLDRTKEDWIKAIADDHLTWTHVSDLQYFNNKAAKLYFVSSIPSNVLLDKNGIIVAKNLRGEALYNKVKELLDSK
jgi:peroxiredoxin